MQTKLKLGTKLLLSFAAVALIALVVGSVGYYGANKNQEAMREAGSVRLPGVDSLLRTKAILERIRAVVETITDADLSVELRKKAYDELAQLRENYTAALKTYETLPKTREEASLVNRFEPTLAAWRAENNKALELSSNFEGFGIVGPESLATKIEQFTKDHYVAVQKVLLLLRSQDNAFAGGDDDTACNAGKWLPTFQSNNAAVRAAVQGIVEPHHRFHAALAKIKKLVADGKGDEAGRVFQQEMNPAVQEVFKHFDGMRTTINEAMVIHGRVEEQVDGPVMTTQEAAIALLDMLVQVNRDVAAATVRDSNAQGSFLKRFSLVAMIVGTIAAAILGIFVTRSVTRPIQRVTDQLSAGADHANAAANQVSRASQDLAAGASEQAAAVEETSSSLEELSSMTKRNAENANRANDLAKQACTAAEKGASDMQAMSAAMTDIKTSSDDIAKIIKTIDEIAFQTNILALNAAVEAARAGEAGMGFAVVAEEVRSLAQRSAQAAKDTATKIEGAIGNTAQGVAISAKVADALSEIVTKAREVNKLAAEVAAASNEQTQGITQINAAVGQMDKVVQTNAASAEETSAAAEELNAQAVVVREGVVELLQLVNGRGDTAAVDSPLPAQSANHLGGRAERKLTSTPVRKRHLNRPQVSPTAAHAELSFVDS